MTDNIYHTDHESGHTEPTTAAATSAAAATAPATVPASGAAAPESPARYIYHRCSTDAQTFQQQQQCVRDYLHRMGLNESDITATVTENVSGTVNHTERKLAALLRRCKAGDTIYISELSRLGRNMTDLFAIITETTSRGITIIQTKDGTQIENNSIGGKALLFALSLAAEIEVNNIRQRTQMGMDSRAEEVRKNGYWISNTGRKCTHFGRDKGCNTSAGREVAAMQRQEAAAAWRANSKLYALVKRQAEGGKPRKEILDLAIELYNTNPESYCTPAGKALTAPILSKWCREFTSLQV